jgi:hypothetical protein
LRNLAEIVFQRASTKGDEIAYRFFQGNSLVPEMLTFRTFILALASGLALYHYLKKVPLRQFAELRAKMGVPTSTASSSAQ